MSNRIREGILISSYVLFGILTRTVWHIAPNVEFVTALTISGAYFLGRKYSILIPFGIMILSDLILGNTSIFIFTWSAFAVAWGIGRVIKSRRFKSLLKGLPRSIRYLFLSELGGILFTTIFFLWTNFGVVVVSNLYPKTISGLIQSYIMGLPFLMPQLVGNIIIVPSIFMVTGVVMDKKFESLIKGIVGSKVSVQNS